MNMSGSSQDQEKLKPTLRQGLPYKNRNVDYDIWKWRISLLQSRDGKLVSKNEVQIFAREAYKTAGINNFKASDGWYRRWLHRWGSDNSKSNCKNKTEGISKIPDKKLSNGSKNSKMYQTQSECIHEADINTNSECSLEMNTAIYKSQKLNQKTSIYKNTTESSKENEEGKFLQKDNFDSNSSKPEQYLSNENDIKQNASVKRSSVSIDSCTIYASIIDDYDEYGDIISKAYNFNQNKTISFKSNDIINSILNSQQESILLHPPEKHFKPSTGNNSNDESNIKNAKYKNCDIKLKLLGKGERYLPNFKTKVTNCALSNDIKTAASKFNVNRGTVSQWLKEKNRNKKSRMKKNIDETPVSANDEAPDVSFIKWLKCNPNKLNHQMVVRKTLEIYNKHGEVTLQKTCPWFLAYTKRLNSKTFARNPSDKKYILYPESFKILVATYAKSFSQLGATRLFLIARKRVFEWLSQLNSTGTIKPKDPTNSASYVTDPKIDSEILKWYKEQTVAPTSKQIREKGRLLYKKAGYTISCSHGWYYRWRRRLGLSSASSEYTVHDAIILEWILTKLDNNQNISHSEILNFASKLKKSKSSSKFNSSLGWVLRFCKRYPELLQAVPDVVTPLPTAMEIKVKMFKNSLLSYTKEENISFNRIVLIDEVPLNFLLTGNSKRKMLIRRPGFDTCLGSLVVSSTADGVILPFVLILKGAAQSLPECRGPRGCIVTSDTGHMDLNTMRLWLQEICFKQTMDQGMLINDNFEVHTDTLVLDLLSKNNVKQFVIPGGCSSKLQPLNQITQKLKNDVEVMWTEMVAAKCWTDSSSHLKLPSHSQIFDWVQKSFLNIACGKTNIIKEAFDEIFSHRNADKD